MNKSISLFCLLALLTFPAIELQAKGGQVNAGPFGRINVVAVIDSDVFAGTNGGSYRSTDSGASWTKVNGNFTLCFAKSGSYIFGGTGSGVIVSNDHGNTWNAVGSDLTYYVTALAVIDTDIFAGTYQNGLFRSTDNGLSWTAVDNGLVDFQYLVTALVASGTKLYAGTASGLCRSTDSGSSWSTVAGTGISPLQFTNCVATNGSTIFVGTPNGMLRSTDGDTSWEADNHGLAPDGPGAKPSIFSITVNGAYTFVGTTASVFLSTDNGNNWVAANKGLPTSPSQVISVAAAGSDLFAGTTEGVFLSTNNGTTWKSTTTGIAGSSVPSPDGFELAQNYPNPFNPTTVIRYQIPTNSYVSLEVYDLLGRKIGTLVSQHQSPGAHAVTFNASNLSSGVYFYRLTAGRFIETKKLMLTK